VYGAVIGDYVGSRFEFRLRDASDIRDVLRVMYA
jgi:hypothetical protein